MPSEKMKYILRRAEQSALRTDIALSPLKKEIEQVFSPSNIDQDCDTIDRLLTPFEDIISDNMSQGKYHEAFEVFLKSLKASLITL